MKLTKVRITNFQSIEDSNEFDVGDVTCLVGKNESGKTALLKALQRLNPSDDANIEFEKVAHYPRRMPRRMYGGVEAINNASDNQVVRATFRLDEDELNILQDTYGDKAFSKDGVSLTLSKGYSNNLTSEMSGIDADAVIQHLVSDANLPIELISRLEEKVDPTEILYILRDSSDQTAAVQSLTQQIQQISESSVEDVVIRNCLEMRIPKFLYFDEYHQLRGEDNLASLSARVKQNAVKDYDRPLLGLISLAGLDVDSLINIERTEELRSRLEWSSNALTNKALHYWSQNRHLRLEFDVREGRSSDPVGMTNGLNIWGLVEDTKHRVSTRLGTRSKGFVWFFSFLAWYQYHKDREDGMDTILLLDEPGLSLHAKAQNDLLQFFEQELIPNHQLIYTTHSPFMVDPNHFERVRIVQDRSVEPNSDDLPASERGTKVSPDVLSATADSLFPLQAALGYQIHQTLFVGPNNLVVEGTSDLLYLQTMKSILNETSNDGLRDEWTITPVGGSGNVPAFVSLLGSQSGLNVAVLIDFAKNEQQMLENLYKHPLLKRNKVHTFTEFTGESSADIEDMFSHDFYLQLFNQKYGTNLTLDKLSSKSPRIIERLKQYFKENQSPDGKFHDFHYRVASYFASHSEELKDQIDAATLDRFREAFKVLNGLLP